MTRRLYCVVVDSYPERAGQFWAPKGWRPTEEWVRRHKTTEFFWPSCDRIYRSRSAATERAALFESYGAVAHVEQTAVIEWAPLPRRRLRAVPS